ncbi:MAG: pitrilysin family protein [Gemmobacter sp.]
MPSDHPSRPLAALALAALVAFAALVPGPARAEQVSSFTLGNGLKVVVIEDHRAPVVVHMVWYRVGSADEPPGKSGIAHFLEHLMFKGTANMDSGEFTAIVGAHGGSDNAFTSYDYTGYFQRIAADRLDMVMRMEADRMTGLILNEPEVLTERAVILEERAQRTDSDPGALLSEQRRAAQFLAHPYRLPVIGWRHEIEALGLEDALAFYRIHYAPDNAVLIVAGDVTPEEVRTLAETHYGPIPRSPGLPPRIRPQEPPQIAERRIAWADSRVGQPYVMRSYLAPSRRPGDQAGAAALVVLAELLGGEPATSVLGRALMFGAEPVALRASAFYGATALDDSTFGLAVVPVAGVTLDAAEAAMDAVLARFLDEGPDPEDFARTLTRLRAAEIYARDNTQRAAHRYGEALTSGLTVADVQDWPRVLQSVTPEAVMDAAREVLDRRRAVTTHLEREDTP